MSTRIPGTLSCVVVVAALASASRGQGGITPEIKLDETGWESTIVTDGTGVVVVAWMHQPWPGTSKTLARLRSTDHGATWSQFNEQNDTVAGNGSLDPALAQNPGNGDFYFGWLGPGGGGPEFKFKRSTDGQDLTAPVQVVVAAGGPLDVDRPWLATSASFVYGNWYRRSSLDLRFKRGAVQGDETVDWSGAAVTYCLRTDPQDQKMAFGPPTPIARGSSGYLYSMSKQVKTDSPFDGNAIRVHRSTNDGTSWDTAGYTFTTLDTHPDGYQRPSDFGLFNMHIVADPSSSNVWAFYVDFETRYCGDPTSQHKVSVLYCRRSTNHGQDWSSPVQVIPNSVYSSIACETENFGMLPDENENYVVDGYYRIARVWSCLDAAGRIHVVWMDSREGKHPAAADDNRDLWRVYRSVSSDGGQTFSSLVLPVSTTTSVGGSGNPHAGLFYPPGDHLGCAADDAYLYVTWPDTRHYDDMQPGQAGRIYFRRFQLSP